MDNSIVSTSKKISLDFANKIKQGDIIPTYKKISLDIANKVKQDEIKEGEVLHGRSALASKYNVSPETVRRAIILLEDVEAVTSVKGKGVIILSKEKAISFLERNNSINTLKEYKSDIENLLKERKNIENKLLQSIDGIIDYSSRFDQVNPFIPFEFRITNNCIYLGKTINDIKLWQHTGATLIAVKRDGQLFLSPGPYIIISEDDILIVIGHDHLKKTMPEFLVTPI